MSKYFIIFAKENIVTVQVKNCLLVNMFKLHFLVLFQILIHNAHSKIGNFFIKNLEFIFKCGTSVAPNL